MLVQYSLDNCTLPIDTVLYSLRCVSCALSSSLFFFFQAEDGIRDDLVTGVQTCALPICLRLALWLPGPGSPQRVPAKRSTGAWPRCVRGRCSRSAPGDQTARGRSEERRVGKECRSRWSPDH